MVSGGAGGVSGGAGAVSSGAGVASVGVGGRDFGSGGAWVGDELRRVGDASELRVASRRADGSLRPYATIWHAVVGDDLHIRSAHGPENGWFRRALGAGVGRISSGGVEKDVTFELADAGVREALDAALHEKYDRFGHGPVAAITGSDVLETTLVVRPVG